MSRLKNRVAGGGAWASNAAATNGTVQTGRTAAGSTQGTAYVITEDITEFTTVAIGTGAVLPADLAAGDELAVLNAGANALSLYPPTGGVLNAAAANAAVSVPAGKSAIVRAISPLKAVVVVSA